MIEYALLFGCATTASARSSSTCTTSVSRLKIGSATVQQLGLNIMYSRETELLDTGGGLLKAKAFLQDGSFIVINTDALIDLNLAEVIAFHKSKNAAATLVLRPDENAEQYGSMDIDEHGRICRFLQTRAPIRPAGSIRTLMFSGVHFSSPSFSTIWAPFRRRESSARPGKLIRKC